MNIINFSDVEKDKTYLLEGITDNEFYWYFFKCTLRESDIIEGTDIYSSDDISYESWTIHLNEIQEKLNNITVYEANKKDIQEKYPEYLI
jgi:hypothetical protein